MDLVLVYPGKSRVFSIYEMVVLFQKRTKSVSSTRFILQGPDLVPEGLSSTGL
jgi:hypothetical protein